MPTAIQYGEFQVGLKMMKETNLPISIKSIAHIARYGYFLVRIELPQYSKSGYALWSLEG
jgi:hypothetical protein